MVATLGTNVVDVVETLACRVAVYDSFVRRTISLPQESLPSRTFDKSRGAFAAAHESITVVDALSRS